MSLNKVLLIGNVGAEPNYRRLTKESSVANLSVATSRVFTSRDGSKEERTEWHNVVCFNKLADVAHDYVRKGTQVYVEGELQSRKFTDKDGVDRRITEVRADRLQILDKKPADAPVAVDDMPF